MIKKETKSDNTFSKRSAQPTSSSHLDSDKGQKQKDRLTKSQTQSPDSSKETAYETEKEIALPPELLQARLTQLKASLNAANEALKKQKEVTLQMKAELANEWRRLERETDKIRKFALEKFVFDLLSIVDDLERALDSLKTFDKKQSLNPMIKQIENGINLTLSNFIKILKKYHIEPIEDEGQSFNPDWHEAMSVEINNDLSPNTITKSLKKGYLMHGRLLRAAMVVVSKPSE